MSFCTQGLPGVAESTFQKAKENLLPGVRFPSGRMRGVRKCFYLALNHRLRRSPLSRKEGGYLLDDGFCDFAFGFAQNDRGVRYTAMSESFRIRETNQKGIWCYVYRFLIDASYIGF